MKKVLSVLLAAIMTLACFSCGLAEGEAPVHLKILMPFYNAETSADIVKALEEATGTELEIVAAAYDQ